MLKRYIENHISNVKGNISQSMYRKYKIAKYLAVAVLYIIQPKGGTKCSVRQLKKEMIKKWINLLLDLYQKFLKTVNNSVSIMMQKKNYGLNRKKDYKQIFLVEMWNCHQNQNTGIDLGIKELCITSAGKKYENPKNFEKKLDDIKRKEDYKTKHRCHEK